MPQAPLANDAQAPQRRRTSGLVRVVDRLSAAVITVGGLLVVVAVLGIGVYLVAVAGALFAPGEARLTSTFRSAALAEPAIVVEADEFGASAMQLLPTGELRVFDLRDGRLAATTQAFEPPAPVTAWRRAVRGGAVALGLADGRVMIGRVAFASTFLTEEEPEALRDLAVGQRRVWEGGLVERTPIGQLRLTKPSVEFAQPVRLRGGAGAVRLLDYHEGVGEDLLVALRDDGALLMSVVRRIESLMGGAPRLRTRSATLPFTLPAGRALEDVAQVLVTGDGANALTLFDDGLCLRFDTRDPQSPTLAETVALLPQGRRVQVVEKMLGENTFVIGDDAGGLWGCFVARNELAPTPDRKTLVAAHVFAPGEDSGLTAAVEAIDTSQRGRTFVAADAAGALSVRNMTSHARVSTLREGAGEAVVAAALFPKVDGALTVGREGTVRVWRLNPRHPEASFSSLFGKVWYEGEPAPSYTYQSSSGDDAAEAKFSLVPLLFGTIKATIYTMLLATPLGILAAIYTSEFLTPGARAVVKPSLEMMASLPSVVLGFVAAMLLAPLLRDALPGALLAFALIPTGVLLAAHLWHFAPVQLAARAGPMGRLAMIALVTLLSGAAAIEAGPLLERALFAPSERDVLIRAGAYEPIAREEWPKWMQGATSVDDRLQRRLREEGLAYRDGAVVRPVGSLDDPEIARTVQLHGFDRPSIRAWLDGVIGGPWPGWLLIAFPIAALVVAALVARVVDPLVRSIDAGRSPPVEALVELLKFALSLAATTALAALLATLLTGLGLDPRDSIFGAYQQRNTLVVALAMAVAVTPIIYTIVDDAMVSVPQTMRAASLGAGATRWQTAVRVVLPVAMSGVFSAVMIGLGRAAGETMIVLMATGNTPIMSWSLFDGLRTLSANIAVELPEAPRDSAHYRVLFLCGLVLFALTFCVNTAAEIVRQRVRKRSAAL